MSLTIQGRGQKRHYSRVANKPCKSSSKIDNPTLNTGCVYFHIAEDGEILYIGMSTLFSVKQRQSVHKYKSRWWDQVESFRLIAVEDAASYETAMINKYKPRFNVIDNPDFEVIRAGHKSRVVKIQQEQAA